MNKFLLVAIGGAAGSVLRFGLGIYVNNRVASRFPYSTLIINVTACFLIGFLVTLLADSASWNSDWRYLASVGFLGGYSTFSAFEYETFRAFQEGDIVIAGLNVIVSVAAGFVAVWLGYVAGKRLA